MFTALLDYNQFGQVVTFPAGSTAPQCVNVQINSDNIAELEECFFLNAFLAAGSATIDPSQTAICIQDADCKLPIIFQKKHHAHV